MCFIFILNKVLHEILTLDDFVSVFSIIISYLHTNIFLAFQLGQLGQPVQRYHHRSLLLRGTQLRNH